MAARGGFLAWRCTPYKGPSNPRFPCGKCWTIGTRSKWICASENATASQGCYALIVKLAPMGLLACLLLPDRSSQEGSVENPDVGQVGRQATCGPIVNRPARRLTIAAQDTILPYAGSARVFMNFGGPQGHGGRPGGPPHRAPTSAWRAFSGHPPRPWHPAAASGTWSRLPWRFRNPWI